MSENTTGRNDEPGANAVESNAAPTRRRSVLKGLGGLGAAGLLGSAGAVAGSSASTSASNVAVRPTLSEHSSPDLEKWVDAVPRPGVVEPSGTKEGQPYYELEMREVERDLHRDLPPTTVWGYEGQYPGPTIEARQGEPVYVRWKNDLPDEHLLPEDPTVHADEIPYETTGVRTVTHLHGGHVEAESDGKTQAWFTRDFADTGPEFEKKDYYYANEQPPATLWYHDHSLGTTRLNVYAGLAGFYLLRNEHEESLGLPEGEYEIPLVLQDRSFEEDGSLFYPTAVSDGGDDHPDPSIVPAFYGDTSVVNGKAWPRLSVEPRKYRLRLLNGANSRFYDLELLEYDEASGEIGDDGPPFVQIGNDGGLLSEPVTLDGRLELEPAGRADVVVDFSAYAGETLLLHNDAKASYGDAAADETQPLPEVMLVEVADADGVEDSSQVPNELTTVPDIPSDAVDRERYLTLAEDVDEYGRMLHLLGTEDEPSGLELFDPVTETPELGDVEIWSFANLTGVSHPIHLHVVHFQVLGRQSMTDYSSADGVDLDSLEPPEPFERGWNDTVTAHPGEVTHVAVPFGEYEGLFSDQTGEYMWHCHMLEHEDHEMMRPFTITGEEGGGGGNGDDDDGGYGDRLPDLGIDDGVPGFGPIAGAAGIGGGVYAAKKLGERRSGRGGDDSET